jgi:hypothetical protein
MKTEQEGNDYGALVLPWSMSCLFTHWEEYTLIYISQLSDIYPSILYSTTRFFKVSCWARQEVAYAFCLWQTIEKRNALQRCQKTCVYIYNILRWPKHPKNLHTKKKKKKTKKQKKIALKKKKRKRKIQIERRQTKRILYS